MPLYIKTDMRAAVTMEAAGCRFYVRAIPYLRIWGCRIPLNLVIMKCILIYSAFKGLFQASQILQIQIPSYFSI